jgi:sulfoxide reductase heme-binding subunit YedZ
MRSGAGELEKGPPLALHLLVPAAALLVDLAVALAAPQSRLSWYVIRASGIVAYVLLAVTVAAGLTITGKAVPAGRARVDAYELHSFAALLILGFASVHGAALLVDRFIGFNLVQITVPFTSSYRPVSVAMGIIGFYATAVVYASFWARRYIGYQGWRRLHYASFAAFVLASWHGILSGSDGGRPWMLAVYFLSLGTILVLLAYRLMVTDQSPAPRPA